MGALAYARVSVDRCNFVSEVAGPARIHANEFRTELRAIRIIAPRSPRDLTEIASNPANPSPTKTVYQLFPFFLISRILLLRIVESLGNDRVPIRFQNVFIRNDG